MGEELKTSKELLNNVINSSRTITPGGRETLLDIKAPHGGSLMNALLKVGSTTNFRIDIKIDDQPMLQFESDFVFETSMSVGWGAGLYMIQGSPTDNWFTYPGIVDEGLPWAHKLTVTVVNPDASNNITIKRSEIRVMMHKQIAPEKESIVDTPADNMPTTEVHPDEDKPAPVPVLPTGFRIAG